MAADLSDEALDAQLKACVATAADSTIVAPYAVNEAMIAAWADALLDRNPIYIDDAGAQATGRPGIIAPPTMIQAWIMPTLSDMARASPDVPGYQPYIGRAAAASALPDQAQHIYKLLAEHGYSNSAATNCGQVYHRELRPGDHVRCIDRLEAVSPRKQTAMGAGYFITTRWDYLDQEDRPVATQHWTVLRFRAPTAAETTSGRPDRTATAPSPQPMHEPAGPLAGMPQPGQMTSPTTLAITPTFVIATAIATRDFYAIHHDVDWARSIGRPNIFTNILTTTGLVGGVMTGWGGPSVRLRSIDLRLLAPNYPGDELTLRGRVTSVSGEEVTMAVTGTNRLGTHVEAVAVGIVPGR